MLQEAINHIQRTSTVPKFLEVLAPSIHAGLPTKVPIGVELEEGGAMAVKFMDRSDLRTVMQFHDVRDFGTFATKADARNAEGPPSIAWVSSDIVTLFDSSEQAGRTHAASIALERHPFRGARVFEKHSELIEYLQEREEFIVSAAEVMLAIESVKIVESSTANANNDTLGLEVQTKSSLPMQIPCRAPLLDPKHGITGKLPYSYELRFLFSRKKWLLARKFSDAKQDENDIVTAVKEAMSETFKGAIYRGACVLERIDASDI